MELFNSTCKYQTFYGANNIDNPHELKTHGHSPVNMDRNAYKNRKNKKKKQTTQECIGIHNKSNNTISWRPKLHTIFKDELLLNALIAFSTESYNIENILFLQSIKELHNTTDAIDDKIISIYNLFINHCSQYQINLSSQCFHHTLSKRFIFQTLNHKDKYSLFDDCVHEIEHLVCVSILPSFYHNKKFQNIAIKSRYYTSYLAESTSKHYNRMRRNSKIRSFSPRSRAQQNDDLEREFATRCKPSVHRIISPSNGLLDVPLSDDRYQYNDRDESFTRHRIKAYKIRTSLTISVDEDIVATESPISVESTSASLCALSNSVTEIYNLDVCADFE